jgi:hypothetical protein
VGYKMTRPEGLERPRNRRSRDAQLPGYLTHPGDPRRPLDLQDRLEVILEARAEGSLSAIWTTSPVPLIMPCPQVSSV